MSCFFPFFLSHDILYRLATLIPLAGHKPATDCILNQVSLHQNLQEPSLVAIFGLLCGSPEAKSERYGIDWMRSFGKYLWYTTDDMPTQGTPNMDCLVAAIQEFNDRQPVAPLPPWMTGRRGKLPDGCVVCVSRHVFMLRLSTPFEQVPATTIMMLARGPIPSFMISFRFIVMRSTPFPWFWIQED